MQSICIRNHIVDCISMSMHTFSVRSLEYTTVICNATMRAAVEIYRCLFDIYWNQCTYELMTMDGWYDGSAIAAGRRREDLSWIFWCWIGIGIYVVVVCLCVNGEINPHFYTKDWVEWIECIHTTKSNSLIFFCFFCRLKKKKIVLTALSFSLPRQMDSPSSAYSTPIAIWFMNNSILSATDWKERQKR